MEVVLKTKHSQECVFIIYKSFELTFFFFIEKMIKWKQLLQAAKLASRKLSWFFFTAISKCFSNLSTLFTKWISNWLLNDFAHSKQNKTKTKRKKKRTCSAFQGWKLYLKFYASTARIWHLWDGSLQKKLLWFLEIWIKVN